MKQLFLLLFGLALFVLPYCQAQPLTSEEHPVTLNTASGSINGKLLLPAHAKSCHVVVLIAGSGPTDMDGNNPMMKNNSLKFLAEGLALKGIASLRFDKRGIASSASAGKEESKLRLEDYVNDVTGWIDLLAKDKRFTGITVAGHSEGSLIGMLTCRKRPEVKGFISIAGAGSPAYDLIEKQVAAQMTPESIRKEVASINESLKNGKEVAQVPAYLQTLFRPSVQPYLISWYKYNPQTVIASLKMPILILQGKKDIQVQEEEAARLKKASPQAELILIDKMNHVLKDCESINPQQQMAVYNNPSLPVNAALINAIAEFIKKNKYASSILTQSCRASFKVFSEKYSACRRQFRTINPAIFRRSEIVFALYPSSESSFTCIRRLNWRVIR